MAQLLHGDRIGRLGRLSPGCSALVFDTGRGRHLHQPALERRTRGWQPYPTGALQLQVAVTGGELGLSDETTAFGRFTPREIAAMDMMDHHRERIADAFAAREAAFVK